MDNFSFFDVVYDIDSIKLKTQEMIYEYFKDNNCDEEKLKVLDEVFGSVPVVYSEIQGAENGRVTHIPGEKEIEIRTMYQLDPARAVILLLHEYAHALSNRNWNGSDHQRFFEEGMADAFADVIFNYHLNKNDKFEINGNEIFINRPYKSRSAYINENAFVKTMLYVLETKGVDNKFIMEYVAGSKNKCFQDVLNIKEVKDYIINLNVTGNEILTNFDADYGKLYYNNQELFKNINKDSVHCLNNFIVHKLEYKEFMKKNEHVIEEKNFYDIDIELFDEYYRLSELSDNDWISKANAYIKSVYNDDVIIKENSKAIFERLQYLIYSKQMYESGRNITVLVSKVLKVELERILENRNEEELRGYYDCIHNVLIPLSEKMVSKADKQENHIVCEQFKAIDKKLEKFFFKKNKDVIHSAGR